MRTARQCTCHNVQGLQPQNWSVVLEEDVIKATKVYQNGVLDLLCQSLYHYKIDHVCRHRYWVNHLYHPCLKHQPKVIDLCCYMSVLCLNVSVSNVYVQFYHRHHQTTLVSFLWALENVVQVYMIPKFTIPSNLDSSL